MSAKKGMEGNINTYGNKTDAPMSSSEASLPCLLSSDPKAETRLYVTVNGLEFHVYNRTDLYARLQETFGLEPTLLTPKKDEERGRDDRNKTLERYSRVFRSTKY